jgi:glutathione S-transferase
MTAEALGVEYNFKELNIMAGENKTPEYLAINPQHNIPAIVDGDFKGQSRKILFLLLTQHSWSRTYFLKLYNAQCWGAGAESRGAEIKLPLKAEVEFTN